MAIKHKFVSPKVDDVDPDTVSPSNWNDDHDAESLVICTGIPAVTPTGKLHIEETRTDLSGAVNSIYQKVIINPSSNGTGNFRNLEVNIETNAGNVNNIAAIRSYRANAYHNGTGIVNTINGVQVAVQNQSTGTVTNMHGDFYAVGNSSTGIITSLYGRRVSISNTGTIDTAYGSYIDYLSNTGTITNAYGLYINQVLGTNKWGIYVNDTSPNYLAGNLEVNGQLKVNGGTIISTKTPASATDTGTAGEVCWDANFVYICVSTNAWKRAALSTW